MLPVFFSMQTSTTTLHFSGGKSAATRGRPRTSRPRREDETKTDGEQTETDKQRRADRDRQANRQSKTRGEGEETKTGGQEQERLTPMENVLPARLLERGSRSQGLLETSLEAFHSTLHNSMLG